ncbi:uncharacterized protein LOC111354628 [Spodoptera litura]|uniref:Uncharacterized protein LOC111354628 n=1 Tax=Spodoptera litura TaxID=69820 RepID=A0A9J7EA97_SPOLT|nr:uncharacterized protein LOC111354628 [Spodoptera litura]
MSISFQEQSHFLCYPLNSNNKQISSTTLIMASRPSRKQFTLLLRKIPLKNSSSWFNVKNYTDSTTDFTMPAGIPGSGAGKGGGAGGSVRESGGSLGRYGAAQEEGYFHQQQREQIEKLKEKLKRGEDIGFSEKPPKPT